MLIIQKTQEFINESNKKYLIVKSMLQDIELFVLRLITVIIISSFFYKITKVVCVNLTCEYY